MLMGCQLTGFEHGRALKLFGLPAAHTDQMVVVAMGCTGQLKAPASFGQFELLQQSHRTEQPQGSIHRGQGHALIAAQQALMDLFGTEVGPLTDALEQGQHPLALRGQPLPTVMQAGAQAA